MKENRLKVNLHLLLLPLAVLFLSSVLPRSSVDAEAGYVRRRQLRGENVTVDPTFAFPNFHLRDAYIALQALKLAIISDPLNLTADWVGPGVCNYTGVYCDPSPRTPASPSSPASTSTTATSPATSPTSSASSPTSPSSTSTPTASAAPSP